MEASPDPQPVDPAVLAAALSCHAAGITQAIVIRLADEGIPVRAIARVTATPSADVYPLLKEALEKGAIFEMPRDDWPAGSTRAARVIFHGTILENEGALRAACVKFFKTSPLEGAMLALMVRRDHVTREQLHSVIELNRANRRGKAMTDIKMVDVIICKLRKKLATHDIFFETLWGMGYSFTKECRERTAGLLIGSVA